MAAGPNGRNGWKTDITPPVDVRMGRKANLDQLVPKLTDTDCTERTAWPDAFLAGTVLN
jgi:hypothetical protein